MNSSSELYAGIFRALLTEEALDRAGRQNGSAFSDDYAEIERLVGLSILDDVHVANAKRMSVVYTAIAAFENSVRDLVSNTLLESVGENWWEDCASKKIKDASKARRKDEEKVKWHTQRGSDPIQFTMLPNLLNIIRNNAKHFEDFIHDIDWAAGVFETVEKSRNVIMHSGTLNNRDIARLGTYFRDWNAQVST